MDSLVAYLKENDILSLCSRPPAGYFRTFTWSWGCGRTGQDAKAEAAASFQSGQTAVDHHWVTLVEPNPHVHVTQRYQHFRPSKPKGCQYILIVRTTRLAVRTIYYLQPTSSYVNPATAGERGQSARTSAPLRGLRFLILKMYRYHWEKKRLQQ